MSRKRFSAHRRDERWSSLGKIEQPVGTATATRGSTHAPRPLGTHLWTRPRHFAPGLSRSSGPGPIATAHNVKIGEHCIVVSQAGIAVRNCGSAFSRASAARQSLQSVRADNRYSPGLYALLRPSYLAPVRIRTKATIVRQFPRLVEERLCRSIESESCFRRAIRLELLGRRIGRIYADCIRSPKKRQRVATGTAFPPAQGPCEIAHHLRSGQPRGELIGNRFLPSGALARSLKPKACVSMGAE